MSDITSSWGKNKYNSLQKDIRGMWLNTIKKIPFNDLCKTSHCSGKLQAQEKTEENFDPFKVHDFYSCIKTVVDETHVHKFPCRQVVYDDSGSPFSPPSNHFPLDKRV